MKAEMDVLSDGRFFIRLEAENEQEQIALGTFNEQCEENVPIHPEVKPYHLSTFRANCILTEGFNPTRTSRMVIEAPHPHVEKNDWVPRKPTLLERIRKGFGKDKG